MNTAGRFISRTGATSQNWTISGNLVVANGTLYMGSGGGSYGSTTVGNLLVQGGTFDMDQTTSPVTVTGNLTLSSGTLKLSAQVGGDLNLAGNWTQSGGTFTPSSRQVMFNSSTGAQTITGSPAFDYLRLNNTSGTATLSLSGDISVSTQLNLTAGKCVLGSSNLTLGAGATLLNASSTNFVQTNGTGQLRQTVAGGGCIPRGKFVL